ncbi:DUF6701 domain-containing protein [Vibrio breoganii]
MNKYTVVIYFVLLLLPFRSFATCDVNGSHDFVATFTVVGSNSYQELYMTSQNNGKRQETLWYTQTFNSDSDYIFNEQGLNLGESYNLRIEYSRDMGRAYYYIVIDDEKYLLQDQAATLKTGQLDGQGVDINDLDCSNSDVEPPPVFVPPEVCEYIPAVALSNFYENNQQSTGILQTSGERAQLELERQSLGFADFTQSGSNSGCLYDGSDIAEQCSVSPALQYWGGSPPIFDEFTPLGETIVIDNGEKVTITPNFYTKIEIGNNGSELILDGSGEYWIGEIIVKNNANDAKISLVGDTSAVVHYNRLIIPQSADRFKINSGGDASKLLMFDHSESTSGQSFQIPSNDVEIVADLYISPSTSTENNFQVTGQRVQFSGSLAATSVLVQSNDSALYLSSDCPIIPPPSGGNKTLVITPKTAQALTCDRIPVDFNVIDSNGSPISGYNQSFVATASSLPNGTACWSEQSSGGTCSGLNFTSQFVDGEKTLYLESTTVGELDVSASVAADSLSTTEGPYRFVPFGFQFDPDPAKAVAGKPFSIEVKAVADVGGSCETIDNYTGTKELTLSSTNYQQPPTGTEIVTATNNNVVFSGGSAELELSYFDAGIVSVTISDLDWTNEECGEDCGDYIGDWEGLFGDLEIQSRPWTFALCEPNNADISGTSESGDFFKRSGELFGLDAVPIRWVSDGETDPSTPIEVSAFCNQIDSLETKNFYPDLAPAVNVSLEAELHSPHVDLGSADTGTIGSGLEGVPVDGIPNNTNTSGPVQFSSLKWREAGSIKVTASLKDQADYLFEPINPGYRSVGRFSPNHLAMLDEDSDPEELWTQWDYADGHDGFAYMKQEFPHIFKVQAQANDNTPTLNYGLFNNSFVSNLDYVANTKDQTVDVSLLDRLSVLTFSWSGEDWPKSLLSDPSTLVVTIDDFAFAKKAEDSIGGNEVTDPDGPFDSDNSVFGIEVSTIVDGVDFDTLDIPELNEDTNTGKSFPNQPEFRYGRMNLDDVGGNTAQTLRVPLRVEYWDGSSFVTNQEDSGSLFDATQSYCVQTIWNNLPNGADTSAGLVSDGERQVSDGASDELSATHNPAAGSSNERVQVRLWLRQGSDSPQRTETGVDCTSNGGSFTNQPWLHYNWRNKGDEDPSTVVTFGTFRGNDRIIFKGERGLIGN